MNRKQNHAHAAPAVVQDGREYALSAPRAAVRMNITPASDLDAYHPDGVRAAGEIIVETRDARATSEDDPPSVIPFDALMLDEAGDLWEQAYLDLPADHEGGRPLYRRCDPAEAAEWLTARNPLLRAVFGRGR